MADEQFKFEETLGREIAAAMNDMVAPLRRRIEQLEVRATMADHLKQLETRIQQLEQRDPAPTAKTLKLVHDGS